MKNASKPRKAPPAAVFSLKSTTVIISQDEIDRKIKEESAIKRQAAYLEEFKKANLPTQIFLSAFIRKVLEDALGIIPILSKVVNSIDINNGNTMNNGELNEKKAEQSTRNLLSEISVTGVEYEFDVNSVLRNISPREQSESVVRVIADLRKQGFNGILIFQSLNKILKSSTLNSEIILRFSKTLEMTDVILQTIILELCIQYLCMTLPDSQLPQGFDPRKNEKRAVFEVFRKKDNNSEKNVSTKTKNGNENKNENENENESTKQYLKGTIPVPVCHSRALSISQSKAESEAEVPSALLDSSSLSWTKTCPITRIDDENRILIFLVSYGWEEDVVKYALQVAATLHTTSSSSFFSSSSSSSSLLSIKSAQKGSVSTSTTAVRDGSTAGTPGLLSPILGPPDLPPLGLTALCVLWFATRYRTLYLALPLSTSSSSTSTSNDKQNNSTDEDMKSINITFNSFVASFYDNSNKRNTDDNDNSRSNSNEMKGVKKCNDKKMNDKNDITVVIPDTWDTDKDDANEKGNETDEDEEEEEDGEIGGNSENENEIREEIESLLSIFPDSLLYTKKTIKPYYKHFNSTVIVTEKVVPVSVKEKKRKCHLLTLPLSRVEGKHAVCAARTYMDIYIIPFFNYPINIPMMYVRNDAMCCTNPLLKKSSSENNGFYIKIREKEVSLLLFTQIEIIEKARECQGEASIFQISSYLEEKLALIVSGYENDKEKKKEISILYFLERLYKFGLKERKTESIYSLIDHNYDNNHSDSNIVFDDATDNTTKESKECSAEQSVGNSRSLLTVPNNQTSTSTLNKDMESMSDISSSTMSLKLKKQNKPSFWSRSEKKIRTENVPKSALYVRMAEGRRKLPAHNSRFGRVL